MLNDHVDKEGAFQCFITSLKRSPSYAPAFTSLGVYYSDVASPPDPSRASRCFQKAFELDPREGEAARRLALGFADEREWDLVEVVARRTIDGEGGMIQGAAPNRYQPLNAWAYKALGVVELVCVPGPLLGNKAQHIPPRFINASRKQLMRFKSRFELTLRTRCRGCV